MIYNKIIYLNQKQDPSAGYYNFLLAPDDISYFKATNIFSILSFGFQFFKIYNFY